MENHIKGSVIDIAYKSELTPHPENNGFVVCMLGVGLINRLTIEG